MFGEYCVGSNILGLHYGDAAAGVDTENIPGGSCVKCIWGRWLSGEIKNSYTEYHVCWVSLRWCRGSVGEI